MKIELRNINEIHPYENNPRINDKAVDAVAGSLKEFGFRQPIVVDRDSVIIVGHTRYKAAQKLGLEKVPVHVAKDLNDVQIKAYRLADNQLHELSDWNYELLPIELKDLQGMDFDLGLLGFDKDELAKLLGNEVTEGLTDPDDVPEPPAEPITQPGDIWILGDHRLMCGDSTMKEDVERLMNGQLADMVFTDPPYNISYVGGTEDKMTIKNDSMSAEDYEKFMDAFFAMYLQSIKPAASMYVCHASAWQLETELSIRRASFKVRNPIIWAKNCGAFGFARYKFQHEPIFYCHIEGQSDAWYGDLTQTTVWNEKKPSANRLHPTMKPVEIVQRALVNSSKAGDMVLDLFMGSGTTMIACEQTGRVSYGMELDPIYCDVVVKRYEEFTGQKAQRFKGQLQ
ncbi:MAG: DNA modification methylase [Phycisphaerae bacterium]|jgi:site-specific DNA-methyltransferase (adenine-specific)